METPRLSRRMQLPAVFALFFVSVLCPSVHAQSEQAGDSVPGALRLIGNGALGLTSGENVSTGAFGVDYRDDDFRLMTLITIESSSGGLTSTDPLEFRKNVLPVRNTDDGFFLFGRWKRKNWVAGFQAYANSGSTQWTFQEETDGVLTQTSQRVTLISGGINLIFEPLYRYTVLKNEVQFFVGGGLTARHIGGDVGADSAFRENVLGTNETFFWGPEVVGIIQINDVDVTFSLPVLGLLQDLDVQGLTGTQPFGTVNVQAGLELVLRKRNPAEAELTTPPPPPPAGPEA